MKRRKRRLKTAWRSDPAHLDFVRSCPCCVPGCTRPSQAHHVRTAANSGMGLKPNDRLTVGLCAFHHMEIHSTGQRTFETKYGLDLMKIAKALGGEPASLRDIL